MLKIEQMELKSEETREIYEFTYDKNGVRLHTFFERVAGIEDSEMQPKADGLLLIEE